MTRQSLAPERARGFDEFALARRQYLGADQAGVADPSADRERQDQVEYPGAEKGDEGDGQQDAGKGKEGVHDHDVDDAVHASAVVPGDAANDQAENERDRNHAGADQHGDARAIDDAGEHVAAELVGAQPMRRRRAGEAGREIDRGGIVGRNPGSEDGQHGEDNHQDNPCGGERVQEDGAPQALRRGRSGRDAGGSGRNCGHELGLDYGSFSFSLLQFLVRIERELGHHETSRGPSARRRKCGDASLRMTSL